MHFFNPPGLMQLVEVTPAVQTSDNTVREVIELSESWGKIAVRAKDTPGFIVNRIARPFYSEALRIFEEGYADIPTIDWAMKEIGVLRMGHFELRDYIGNDVNYAVTETVWKQCYYEPRYKPSFTQKRIVEAGYLGRKTGRGYYDYSDVANIPEATKNSSQAEMIVSRIVTMLMNEAADAVNWRIASVEDIDLAMTRGANYPKGLLRWADERGIEKVVEAMDALFDHYHEERYRCCPLLRSMAQIGAAFYDD